MNENNAAATTKDHTTGACDFTRHLVVIDMQNDFLTGALANPDAIAILPKVIAKVDAARKAGAQVSWTLDTHGEDYLETQEGKKLPVPHCIEGTWGHELAADLIPQEDDAQYRKEAFGSLAMAQDFKMVVEQKWMDNGMKGSPFSRSDKGIEIELVGVCTDICVISNAMLLKAALPEARIVVDASCCAGVTPASHENALTAMEACQIEVVTDPTEPEENTWWSKGMDVTDYEDGSFRNQMLPCPNCGAVDGLHVMADLASLNSLEYWVWCEGCDGHWTGRELGTDLSENPEVLVAAWNVEVDHASKSENAGQPARLMEKHANER